MATLYKVRLKVQRDDYGTIGFVPANCDTFNSAWDPIMIFHDVFEHWFEHEHKYFRGDAAENIGGEMAAMGALWYIYENFQAAFRIQSGYTEPQMQVANATIYLVTEPYSAFGNELISHVPKQPGCDSEELEYIIEKVYNAIKESPASDLKKSATFRKIADLHRYGYNMAGRLFPCTWENMPFFSDFYSYWKEFFKYNPDPDEYFGQELEIVISKKNGLLNWQAYWEGKRLSKNEAPYLTDFLIDKKVYF